jgi:SAM-dependent methyltransferase
MPAPLFDSKPTTSTHTCPSSPFEDIQQWASWRDSPAPPEPVVFHRRQSVSDLEHDFVKTLCYGDKFHSSIPVVRRNVADVGGGNGQWLLDLAENTPKHLKDDYVVFDISSAHFPHDSPDGVLFETHDVRQPFSSHFHRHFDVVHVRFLADHLRKDQLGTVLNNIIQIIKPGGYLQWQELDITDMWCVPSPESLGTLFGIAMMDRIESGLVWAAPMELLSAIMALRPSDASLRQSSCGAANPTPWAGYTLRLLSYQMISTAGHRSVEIKEWKTAFFSALIRKLVLRTADRMARRSAQQGGGKMGQKEKREGLLREAERLRAVAQGVEAEARRDELVLDGRLMWLVAQKST